jgi:hypothetical protein
MNHRDESSPKKGKAISQITLSIPTPLVLRVRKIYLYNAGEPSYPSLGIDATVFPFLSNLLRSFPFIYLYMQSPHPVRHIDTTITLYSNQLATNTNRAITPTFEEGPNDKDGEAPDAAGARLEFTNPGPQFTLTCIAAPT